MKKLLRGILLLGAPIFIEQMFENHKTYPPLYIEHMFDPYPPSPYLSNKFSYKIFCAICTKNNNYFCAIFFENFSKKVLTMVAHGYIIQVFRGENGTNKRRGKNDNDKF